MNREDIFVCSAEERLDTDEMFLQLRSRFFDLRWTMSWSTLRAPPQLPAVNMVTAVFGPLFRAFYDLPFSKDVTRPLLSATMDNLLPRLHARLEELGNFYIRSTTGRLIRDPNPPVTNFLVQGEMARQHMDAVEETFRRAAEDPTIQPSFTGIPRRRPHEPEVFLEDLADMRPGRIIRTATEQRIRDEANYSQIHRHAFGIVEEFERAIFYGEGARSVDRQAVARSRETLLTFLTDVQKAEFERTQSFTVVAQDGQMYKVLQAKTFNVRRGDWEYCAVPKDQSSPVFDYMLASKCWLEAEFSEFMQVANRRNLRTGNLIHGRQRPEPYHYWQMEALSSPRRGRLNF